jgi:Mn-dependent DtxR family transcriptional regulator
MAEPKPLSSDIYSPYEAGLRLMLDRLGRGHPRYSETLVYQQRLTENISQARLYGDTDTRKSERAEVIDRLNELSLAVLGLSFNELCDQVSPSPTRKQAPIASSLTFQTPPEISEDKLKFLYWVYVKTNGTTLGSRASPDDIANELGLAQLKTIEIGEYLDRKGLVEFETWVTGIKITHEGVVKAESDFFESKLLSEYISPDEVRKIGTRKQDRSRFLRRLYEETEGDTFKRILTRELASDLGLDHQWIVTGVIPYLAQQEWIKARTNDSISITEEGKEKVESETAHQSPQIEQRSQYRQSRDEASPLPIRIHEPPDGLLHRPRIFLCHAKEDKPRVKELYHQLKEAGYHPWLDEEDLLPGQDWWAEIKKIISNPYNLVVVCLSAQSVTKRGVVQREIKRALDVLDQMPESAIYLIPARLEPCQVPDRLSRLHWVNLFERQGFEKLRQALDFEVNKRISPSDGWPKAARIVDQAGKNLKLRFGEEPLRAEDIQREVEHLGGYAKGAIIPADYCYNRVNKAPYSLRYPVFEWIERGRFRYLGPNNNYTGSIFWKPRGAPERQVGEWRSGVCHLWKDPRNA